MASFEQKIHKDSVSYQIPGSAFIDVNVPTDNEVLVWANLNVPFDNAEGSLLWYKNTGDVPDYVWRLFTNELNVYSVKRIKEPTTEWLSGNSAPDNSQGKNGDFFFRTPTGQIYVKNFGSWSPFFSVAGLPGPPGADGLNGKSAYELWLENGNSGTVTDFLNSLIGPSGANGSPGINGTNGTNGIDGTNGTNGKEIQLSNDGTYIKWRYVGDVSWNNLVALDTLKGEDGKEIELDNNGVYIRWRYVGESWVNLITLSSLKGNDGADGMALTVNHTNTTMNWNSFNYFEDADAITSVSIVSPLGVAPGSLLGINNTRSSGNITISIGSYSFIGYVSPPFSITPGHGAVFVYLGANKMTLFSTY